MISVGFGLGLSYKPKHTEKQTVSICKQTAYCPHPTGILMLMLGKKAHNNVSAHIVLENHIFN